jgi:hypothetical protein
VTPPTGTGGVEGSLAHVELDLESAIDLTLQVAANGSLQFEPPEPNSTWRIFSFWEKYTNQKSCVGVAQADTIIANGSWTVDHFSAAGAKITTDFFEQHVLDDTDTAGLIRAVGSYGKSSRQYGPHHSVSQEPDWMQLLTWALAAWEDSMEHLATLYWTPGLLDDFEKARGYSLLKYLPVLFRPDNNWGAASPSYAEIFVSANSTAVNFDYRRTLSEGYHEYLTHIDEWARQVGVRGYSAQPAYNLAMDMVRAEVLHVGCDTSPTRDLADLADALHSCPASRFSRHPSWNRLRSQTRSTRTASLQAQPTWLAGISSPQRPEPLQSRLTRRGCPRCWAS